MQNPFEYGGTVGAGSFCNRIVELKNLKQAAENAGKLFICGERRIGKTSLLYQLMNDLPDNRFMVAFIDVWRCTDSADFLRECAEAFGSVQPLPPKGLLERARSLFQGLRPAITIDNEGKPQLTFTNISDRAPQPLLPEIISAPKRIADAFPEKRLLVIFDEFQQIRSLGNDRIERILRSEMQKHGDIAYFFCGSRKHLLRQMFLEGGNPLYRSAAHFHIGPIATEHWMPFITERFQKNNITLSDETVTDVCSLTGGHPFYTQMLCATLWDFCEYGQKINEAMIGQALKILLNRESEGYHALWESLPRNARKMLLATAFEEPLTQPSSGRITTRYHLASPSSAQSGIEYLMARDIVESAEGSYRVSDRFMSLWLRRRFPGPYP